MRIQTLHPAEVRRWWGFARPLIQEVFTKCNEPRIPEDVYACLVGNKALLHVLMVAEVPKGILVTEFYPEDRYVNVWVMHFVQNADEHREELLAWLDGFARSHGYSSIRFHSPRAWASLLKGAFKEKSVTYERVL